MSKLDNFDESFHIVDEKAPESGIQLIRSLRARLAGNESEDRDDNLSLGANADPFGIAIEAEVA